MSLDHLSLPVWLVQTVFHLRSAEVSPVSSICHLISLLRVSTVKSLSCVATTSLVVYSTNTGALTLLLYLPVNTGKWSLVAVATSFHAELWLEKLVVLTLVSDVFTKLNPEHLLCRTNETSSSVFLWVEGGEITSLPMWDDFDEEVIITRPRTW